MTSTRGSVATKRVAASPFAGLNQEVVFNFYTDSVRLRFADGELAEVTAAGRAAEPDIRIPRPQFVQLLLGWRTGEELAARHPEVQIAPLRRLFVDALFPRMAGFLYTTY